MARARHLTLILLTGVLVFLSLTYLTASRAGSNALKAKEPEVPLTELSETVLFGDSIAPELGNATAKAELGRASWKLLHTMMARFPETPTPDDQTALKTFIHLFGRLYPCGECAKHFREMLVDYPPQTSGRNAAAGWACFVHNVVNERLEKEIFDCAAIGDFYDCGCGDEDGKKQGGEEKKDGEGDGEEGEKGDKKEVVEEELNRAG